MPRAGTAAPRREEAWREALGTTGPRRSPDPETLQALAALPDADEWPDLTDAERDRRGHVLWEISLRVLEDGPRHATPSPERGRQFIPFAALRGYDEMLAEVERGKGTTPGGQAPGGQPTTRVGS